MMTSTLLKLPIVILVLMLAACSEAVPTATPVVAVDLPESLLMKRWELVEVQRADEKIDLQPIFPVYLNFYKSDTDGYRMHFQSECHDNREASMRSWYALCLVSEHQFQVEPGEGYLQQCDSKRAQYDALFVELIYSLNTYSIEDATLILSGHEETGENDIKMKWR